MEQSENREEELFCLEPWGYPHRQCQQISSHRLRQQSLLPPLAACKMSAVALSSTALPVRRGAVAKCTAARSAFVGRCIALPLAPVRALSLSVGYVCEGGAL